MKYNEHYTFYLKDNWKNIGKFPVQLKYWTTVSYTYVFYSKPNDDILLKIKTIQ